MTAGLFQTPHSDPQRDPESLPRVVPQCIFAAGKQSFTTFVRGADRTGIAKLVIFDELPLEDNGWIFAATDISKVSQTHDGGFFKVTRAPVSSVLKTDGKSPGTGTPIPSESSAGDFHSSDGAH